MRVVMTMLAVLLAAGVGRGGEVDKEKLRGLVELPRVSVKFGVHANEQGIRWGVDEEEEAKDKRDPKVRIEEIRKALVGDAGDAERYHDLAEIYREMKDDRAAGEALKQSIKLCQIQVNAKPKDSVLREALAVVLWENQQPEAAEKEFRSAVELDPRNSDRWLSLAVFHTLRALEILIDKPLGADVDAALEVFARMVLAGDCKPSAEQVHKCLRALDESSRCCDEAIKANPKKFIGHYWRGCSQLIALEVRKEFQGLPKKRADQEAEELLKKVIRDALPIARQVAKDCPDDVVAVALGIFTEIADYYVVQAKDFWEDIDQIGELWKKAPEQSRKAVGEGMARLRVLSEQKDRHAAADALEILGALHCLLGEQEEGEKRLKQAILLEPLREASWGLLEFLAYDHKSKEDYLKVCQEHLKAKDSPRNRLAVATAYMDLGKFDDAIAVLEPVLKSDPKDYKIPWAIGALHLMSGTSKSDLKEFCEHLDIACRRAKGSAVADDDMYFHTTIAIAQALDGQVDKARERLKAVLKSEENHKYAKRVLEALGEDK